MYGWSGGLGAGFAPAPRTENPTYEYTGRYGPDDLVRTGDVADKLLLPIGHEVTSINDVPVADAPLVLLGQPIVKQPIPVYSSSAAPTVVPVIVPAAGLFDSIPWWGWLGGIGAGLYLWKGRK